MTNPINQNQSKQDQQSPISAITAIHGRMIALTQGLETFTELIHEFFIDQDDGFAFGVQYILDAIRKDLNTVTSDLEDNVSKLSEKPHTTTKQNTFSQKEALNGAISKLCLTKKGMENFFERYRAHIGYTINQLDHDSLLGISHTIDEVQRSLRSIL